MYLLGDSGSVIFFCFFWVVVYLLGDSGTVIFFCFFWVVVYKEVVLGGVALHIVCIW